MSPELAVAAGAALGAPARYLLDRAVPRPWGIVAVNLLGSLLAGVAAGLAVGGTAAALLVVGALGSFTTASTLAWDVLTTAPARRAVLLLALHVLPGVALAAAGLVLGRAL